MLLHSDDLVRTARARVVLRCRTTVYSCVTAVSILRRVYFIWTHGVHNMSGTMYISRTHQDTPCVRNLQNNLHKSTNHTHTVTIGTRGRQLPATSSKPSFHFTFRPSSVWCYGQCFTLSLPINACARTARLASSSLYIAPMQSFTFYLTLTQDAPPTYGEESEHKESKYK